MRQEVNDAKINDLLDQQEEYYPNHVWCIWKYLLLVAKSNDFQVRGRK